MAKTWREKVLIMREMRSAYSPGRHRRYVRDANLFTDNAASGIGL